MSNALQQYQFNTHQLNVILDDNGEPWFIAKQVAEILGYSDAHKMTKKLDDDEVQNRQIGGFGNRGVNLINESGLYSAILTSRKPSARAFKKWVTSDVLPAIRKTGAYHLQPTIELNDYAGLLKQHVALQEKHIALLEKQKMPSQASDRPRSWTLEEDETALKLRAEGYGCTRIGFKLGRSESSVRHRLERLARMAAKQQDLFGGAA